MHLVQTMAYSGAEPWHGLGNQLAPKQPLEVWKRAAGMDSSRKLKSGLSPLAIGISAQFTHFPSRTCCTARTTRHR